MKRLLYTLLSLVILFSFCGESFAVDKKTKKDVTKQKVVKKQIPAAKKPPAKTGKVVKPPKGKSKKYDNFIDKNNNGIDDRKEKLVPKAGKQKKKEPKKKKK